MYVLRSTCRSCGGSGLETVLHLGDMPLPSALLLPAQLDAPELTCPLEVAFCRDCTLVQTRQTVSPGEIYDKRYSHLSSYSEAYRAHAEGMAERLIRERRLDGNSHVVEIGSNDGYLLTRFQSRGIPTLGIDPAPLPAAEARRAGIAQMPCFFRLDLANRLAAEGRTADVVLAVDVLSRVPDVHGFLAAIAKLLTDDGIAVLEVPYVADLFAAGGFDSFDHEQYCYFSLTSLSRLIADTHLSLNHVEHFAVHGGTLRAYLSRTPRVQPSVSELLRREAAAGLTGFAYYAGFAHRVETNKARLLDLLDGIKAERKSIVGYGAGPKASTLLNYYGLADNYLDYVVDAGPDRQARFMPGLHLPVLNADRLLGNRSAYAILLDRDARDEVLCRQEAYRRQGGCFIFPVPEPTIV